MEPLVSFTEACFMPCGLQHISFCKDLWIFKLKPDRLIYHLAIIIYYLPQKVYIMYVQYATHAILLFSLPINPRPALSWFCYFSCHSVFIISWVEQSYLFKPSTTKTQEKLAADGQKYSSISTRGDTSQRLPVSRIP